MVFCLEGDVAAVVGLRGLGWAVPVDADLYGRTLGDTNMGLWRKLVNSPLVKRAAAAWEVLVGGGIMLEALADRCRGGWRRVAGCGLAVTACGGGGADGGGSSSS